MLLEVLLVSGLWQQEPCPPALTQTNTTIGALSNSQQLSLCVSDSVLVKGKAGSLTLVMNSTSTAPRCLVYPNGLSPDLTLNLLQSGHVGCWSLYPPAEPIAIVNVGTPSNALARSLLKNFRPLQPRILYTPKTALVSNTQVVFSSTAKVEVQKCQLLGLSCQVRFTPLVYSWKLGSATSKLAKPALVVQAGKLRAALTVSYKIEYVFPGLTSWRLVRPNLISNANPVDLLVSDVPDPTSTPRAPRLVYRPCQRSSDWGC